MKSQISIAKYIQRKLYQQLLDPDNVVSSKCNIPETLIELGVTTVDADGNDMWPMGIYNELTVIINKMEGEYGDIK